MQTNLAYKYRLYPTKDQKERLAKHFGCVRFVWNYFLNERREHYLNNKEDIEAKRIVGSPNYYDNARALTVLKTDKEWLSECNSQSLQASLKHFDSAYKMFFRKTHAFPQFKHKDTRQSFTVPQHMRLKDNLLCFPKFNEGIKIKLHRPLVGRIVVAAISKTTTDKYFIAITVECDVQPSPVLDKAIGIDLGIKYLVTCSDGTKHRNIRALNKLERKLQYRQRLLSKKVKGSSNRQRAQRQVALVHEKIRNIRTDHVHKITKAITNENQVIVAEDLNVKNMMQNHNMAKLISDASWHEIHRQLAYKSQWNGRTYQVIDRYFPSSKMCNSCKSVNEYLTLKQRTWQCTSCNTTLDRDENAAVNILNQGLNIIQAAGIVV